MLPWECLLKMTPKKVKRGVRLCLHINTKACGNAGEKTLWVVNRGGGWGAAKGERQREERARTTDEERELKGTKLQDL